MRVRKVQALKQATASLMTTLNKADPNANVTRVGAIAYTHETYVPQHPNGEPSRP